MNTTKEKKHKKVKKVKGEKALLSENNRSGLGDVMMIPAKWTKAALGNFTYRIRQTNNNYPDVVQAALSATLGGSKFMLNQLPNLAAYKALFDQYRIVMVKFIARPRANVAQVTAATDIFPNFYTVIDYDDAATPASITVLTQYQTCKITKFSQDHVRCFKPRIAMAAYGGGSFTSYTNVGSKWIDTAYDSVEHYGIKFGIDPGATGQTVLSKWSIETELFVEFRQVF